MFSNFRLLKRQLEFSEALWSFFFRIPWAFRISGKQNRNLHMSNHRDLKSSLTLEMSNVFRVSLSPEMKYCTTVLCQVHMDLWLSALLHTRKQAWNVCLFQELISWHFHIAFFSPTDFVFIYIAFNKKKFDFMIHQILFNFLNVRVLLRKKSHSNEEYTFLFLKCPRNFRLLVVNIKQTRDFYVNR